MKHSFLALPLVLALVAPASTQEAVRLKNGKFVAGAVAIDEADKEGFKVQLWDTGATVFVKWSQIPEAERNRLLKRTPDATASAGPAVNLIDGIRLITSNREVIGILVREDATQVYVKTKDSKTPVVVPKNENLIRRDDGIKIKESDAYSNDEMIEARVAKANEKDCASMLEVGRFAASLKMYERAKEFYQKAAAADPARKAEIEEILARNEVLIKEGKAAAALAEVMKLAEDAEFAKAVEAAKKLLADYADTEVVRANPNLVASLEKDAKDFETKKADYLARNVPEMYKAKRGALFGQYASAKYKISEARSLINKADEETVKYLAEKNKCTPEEVNAAWAKREQKPRTATYGAGSWIVKGGQDGGLDTDAKSQPKQPTQQTQQNNPFGSRNSGQNRNNQPAKPVDLGKKLETSAEWWANASQTDRKNFLEAEYAKNSSAVTKEIKTKKCSVCLGEGVLKSTRMGQALDVKCPRCHGAKEDEIIVYW
jgi:tetratricopeptide (TPR) repeat protein